MDTTTVLNPQPENLSINFKLENENKVEEGINNDKDENVVQIQNKKQLEENQPPALHVLSKAALKTVLTPITTSTATTTTSSSLSITAVGALATGIPTPTPTPETTAISLPNTNLNLKPNSSNLKSTSRVLPLVYIPANVKMPSSIAPTVVLASTGNNNKPQPIILQKTANNSNTQTLIPVSVATPTGTKQTYAYLGTIIKPTTSNKTVAENHQQIVLPTNHLPAGLVPAPTNQKLVLTSMAMPKLTTTRSYVNVSNSASTFGTSVTSAPAQTKISNLLLPMHLGQQIKNQATAPVINFKISNGQIQSDSKGSIKVLCDNNNDVKKESKENEKVNETEPGIIDNSLNDKTYELSIPEVPTSKCELSYTISIPDDTNKYFKATTTASSSSSAVSVSTCSTTLNRKLAHEVSILKKCNLNAVERKPDTLTIEPKLEHSDTPEVRKVNPERRRKSQYTYLRDFDEIVVTSGNAWENKNSDDGGGGDKYKSFRSNEITFTKLENMESDIKLPCKKDKNLNHTKSSNDFIEIELVKQQQQQLQLQDVPQLCTEDDQDIRTTLTWKNGIGSLPGSKFKFHTNEFGLIEMLIDNKYETKRESNCNSEQEIITTTTTATTTTKTSSSSSSSSSNNDILRCSECGCYGMPSEFVTREHCSKSCRATTLKAEAKRAYLEDAKMKRKKRKMELMHLKCKRNEEVNEELKPSSVPPPPPASFNNLSQSDEDNTSNDMLHNKGSSNYPWQNGKKGFSWSKYLDNMKAKAAPVKLFKDAFPYAKNGFRPGMKLEGIDPQHPSYFCVMTVSEVQGYRLRLHFDGYPENYDIWVNADSMDIFPVGWCEKYNHALHPPPNIDPKEFNWTTYLKQCKATAAPRHLFVNRAGNTVCPNGFRLGMKLEAVDRKNASLVCVATVTDQMENRFLVHFDSWDDIYDYWADPSSPYIHPVGWCDQSGHSLTPPNDYPNPSSFTWEKYLKETKSVAAAVRAFKQRPSNGFRRGMRLECVDKRVPSVIRVATVDDLRDHQIRVRFDGWPNKYSYWVDDDSYNIHPVGWCQKTGHPLESPLTPEDVYENFECPTVGCRGLGHIKGPKYVTHSTSKDCPYSDENLDLDSVLPDRLSINEQDFKQESVVPVSREPKEKIKQAQRRPPKLRRMVPTETNEIKSEWPLEEEEEEDDGDGDDYTDTRRKHKLSSSTTTNRDDSSMHSPPSLSNTISEELTDRLKTLVNDDFNTCPSQRVLAKHSKLLHDIISTNSTPDPRIWSLDEVSDFVNSLPSCKEHAKLFVTHKIDGEAFLMLTQRDLVDILKFKLGPAIKLYNSIVLLRQNVHFYNH